MKVIKMSDLIKKFSWVNEDESYLMDGAKHRIEAKKNANKINKKVAKEIEKYLNSYKKYNVFIEKNFGYDDDYAKNANFRYMFDIAITVNATEFAYAILNDTVFLEQDSTKQTGFNQKFLFLAPNKIVNKINESFVGNKINRLDKIINENERINDKSKNTSSVNNEEDMMER